MSSYYNEIEPYPAQWIRNLIKKGLLPDGEVDERSIIDVQPDELRGFTQCHFFAGIGGWSHALRLAGWPDDRQIWTGSCPCQPFSVAGKGLGTSDPRHLWPHYNRLIAARRPSVVMGEQVAGAAGYGWLDGVRADLAREGYACGAVDIPACAVDAPHIRQRLYWVAEALDDSAGARRAGDARSEQVGASRDEARRSRSTGRGGDGDGDMADADVADGWNGQLQRGGEQRWVGGDPQACARSNMADAARITQREQNDDERAFARENTRVGSGWRSERHSVWSNAIWLTGADGKARRSQPGLPLLAHGIPARVGRLRAYGNAIVPQVAAEIIKAFMDVRP